MKEDEVARTLAFSNFESLCGYIRIARIDHWFKNVFMLPDIALAFILTEVNVADSIFPILVGVFATCLIASANYTINEWLDAEFDRHHPVKKNRPSAVGLIKKKYVYLEYVLFATGGLALASTLTYEFFGFSVILLVMGMAYNIPPVRTKDKFLLDVLSESVNNPLRLLLGWSILVSNYLPPSSILISYWMGGAFLMAMKRYAEFRFINNPKRAGSYRASFKSYSEESLLLSSFFYALTSSFFLAVFLIKYRVEFLLAFPLFALLFTWYLRISMRPGSASQTPEKLYREKRFMTFVGILSVVVTILFFVDIPWLHIFLEPVRY